MTMRHVDFGDGRGPIAEEDLTPAERQAAGYPAAPEAPKSVAEELAPASLTEENSDA